MPNWVKKSNRKARKLLREGEEVRAAMFVRPRTQDGTKKLGAPGGALGKIDKLADAGDAQAQEGRAGRFPATNAVLAVTDERLLVFGHNPLIGTIRPLEAEYARDEITDMQVAGRPGTPDYALAITFSDETEVQLTPGTRLRRFVEACGYEPPPPFQLREEVEEQVETVPGTVSTGGN